MGGYTPSSAIPCNFDNEFACDKPHYPFELPKGWCWTTVGNIAESNIGLTYKPSDICLDGIPVYRSNNIKNGHIDLSDVVRVNTKILEKQFLNEGDLLICARNGSRRLVGKNAIISQLDEPAAFGAFMAVCRSSYNPWICLVLNTTYFDRYLDDSNSTTINQVTQSMLLAFPIPFPPKNEQDRIINEVAQLESVVANINDNIDCLNTVIKQTKSKILNLAIHGKLVPQDPNDEPASELLKRINPKAKITCDNPQYGKLPNGWCEVQLGDVFNHNTGKALNASNTEGSMKRYLTTSNVYWNTFDFTTVKQMYYKDSELDKCSITKGDLLVCEGGDVGRAAIWTFNYDICIQNHLHRLRPKLGDLCVSLYYYVFYYLKVNNMIGGKGIGLLGLSSNALHRLHVPLPPINEQHRIVAKIEELFAQLDNITSSI